MTKWKTTNTCIGVLRLGYWLLGLLDILVWDLVLGYWLLFSYLVIVLFLGFSH